MSNRKPGGFVFANGEYEDEGLSYGKSEMSKATEAQLRQSDFVADLRPERLIDRKRELRRLLLTLAKSAVLRYADHLEHYGIAWFQRVCEMDLEGIVAKHTPGLMLRIGSGARGSRFGIVQKLFQA